MERISKDKLLFRSLIFSLSLHTIVAICVTFNFKFSSPAGHSFRPLEVSLIEPLLADKGDGFPPGQAPTPKAEPMERTEKKVVIPPSLEAKESKQMKEVPLAKREVNLPKPKEEVQKETKRTLDEALTAIKERVKKEEEERAHLREALQKLGASKALEKDLKFSGSGQDTGNISSGIGVGGSGGLAMDVYRAQITNLIWSNWNFPANLYEESRLLKLEAVVRLLVERSGKILEYKVIKRSNDGTFDNSIIRAIEKSNPLPPFPESYQYPKQEIDVIFNVRELIENG